MCDKKRDAISGDGANKLLADLCGEAAARHGPNWPAIEQYVADRLQNMDADERTYLMLKVQEILKFAPPMRRPDSIH